MLEKGRYNATMTKPTLVREDTAMDMQRAKSAADSQAAATPRQVALVRRACSLIDAQDCERMTLAQIARALEVSPWHLQRLFKHVMGVTPAHAPDARRHAALRPHPPTGYSHTQPPPPPGPPPST